MLKNHRPVGHPERKFDDVVNDGRRAKRQDDIEHKKPIAQNPEFGLRVHVIHRPRKD